jgi:phosphoserine aminotransferase
MTTGLRPVRPDARPLRPHFSSGPTAKHPGWNPAFLARAVLGRSHRSTPGRADLRRALGETRDLLGVPKDYRIAVVPASDTGAMEMALWSLLGPRGVDVLAFESFGQAWAGDVAKQLRLSDVRVLEAPYGELPDLSRTDSARDIVFTWNGTTSGVRVPDGNWIAPDREGLTVCDATSAAFAQDLAWDRLDAVTFSWQKALGGEAAHGMLVLSPRAVQRLESWSPPWPLPKIFRLTKGGRLIDEIFDGATINTPSMMCVADWLDALAWARSVGGLEGLMARADANLEAVAGWVGRTPFVDFLARNPATVSNTSVCLKIVDPAFAALPEARAAAIIKNMADRLEAEGAAYDIAAHRDAPPGLRIWCGATVETADLEALFPWLEWAYAEARSGLETAA